MFAKDESGQLQYMLGIGIGLVGAVIGIALFLNVFQAGIVNTAALTAAQLSMWNLLPTIAIIVVVVVVLLGAFGGRR